ncbi:MAG: RNA polymerase sigma factor RpoD/SigA [Thermodesulfobacteriota bacterium]
MTTPVHTLFPVPSEELDCTQIKKSKTAVSAKYKVQPTNRREPILGQQEEQRHAGIIRDNYFFIVEQINDCAQSVTELIPLVDKLAHWKNIDKAIKPGKRRLDYMLAEVERCMLKNRNNSELRRLLVDIHKAADKIEKSKDVMITSNLRLVGSIAKRYQDRGLSLADLVQEGCLGLMRAVFRFDYQAGLRFSTYASWWIRQSITRSIPERTLTIKLPAHFLASRNHYNKTFSRLQATLGRKPSLSEIADECYLSPGKIKMINELAAEPISLETPVGENNVGLINLLEDANSRTPGEKLERTELTDQLEQLLDTLTSREADVIRLRFGIGVDKEYTLEEIGHRFKVSRERIRQIEQAALTRLRHPSRSDQVRYYMEA